MKKWFIFTFLMAWTGLSFAVTTPSTSLTGEGTADVPYQINSIADLYFLRDRVNALDDSYWSAYYELKADLDLANEGEWTPIGLTSIDNCFRGSFDGKGHVIRNLKYGTSTAYSNAAGTYVGFFGGLRSGSISNLKVENIALYATVASGEFFVGGIVGSLRAGVINNCSVSGTIKCNTNSVSNIGGIAGKITPPGSVVDVLVANCSTSGVLEGAVASGTNNLLVGGIVGNSAGSTSTSTIKVVNCYSSSDVSAIGTSGATYAGGIVAQFTTGTNVTAFATNCYASGNIYGKSTGNIYVGGIVGRLNNADAKINYCIALNSRIILEGKASDCFRIASLNAGTMSDNYALTESMTIQRPNSSGNMVNVSITSNAAGAHGADLPGAFLSNQIDEALSKLNGYVTANSSVGSIALTPWVLKSGSDYPVFKESSPTTDMKKTDAVLKAQIINSGNGFDVMAKGLFKVSVYTVNGQQLIQAKADNGRAFVGVQSKGLFIIKGQDAQGNELFSQKHLIW